MNVTTLNMKTCRGYEEIWRHGVNITDDLRVTRKKETCGEHSWDKST